MSIFKNKRRESLKMDLRNNEKSGAKPGKNNIGTNKGLDVKVLGSGCAKCNALEKAAKEALIDLGYEPLIDHITDFSQIASYGVMSTPALVIEGKVVSYGKVLKKQEIVNILKKGED
ncbi:Thioredoxin domain [Peptoniphilus sp. ING2-D1G]|nr:Thioredoxin domain [Peptoniphilus sp. ING2-D1G]